MSLNHLQTGGVGSCTDEQVVSTPPHNVHRGDKYPEN